MHMQAFTSLIFSLENTTEGEVLERVSHLLATKKKKHRPPLMKLTVNCQLSIVVGGQQMWAAVYLSALRHDHVWRQPLLGPIHLHALSHVVPRAPDDLPKGLGFRD